MAIDPKAEEFATYLAALPKAVRDKTIAATNQLTLNKVPDEEVGAPPIKTLGEYLDQEIVTPPVVVGPGLVVRGGVTMLVARSGKGKSAVTMNAAVRWSMGKPLFDAFPEAMAPDGALKILVIENEGAGSFFHETMHKIVNSGLYTPEEVAMVRKNMIIWGDGGWSGFKLDDPHSLQLLHRACADIQPDLIIMEPFRGMWKGEENDSGAMQTVFDAMVGVASAYDCGVWINHHEVKNFEGSEELDAGRGSGAMDAAVGVMFRWKPVKGGDYRELHQVKHRYGPPMAPMRMEFNFDTWSYSPVGEEQLAREIMEHVLENGNVWTNLADMALELHETQDHVRKAAAPMVKDGRMEKKRMAGGVSYRMKEEGGNGGALDV